MSETISERKKKILRIVVDEYIDSATPVSSKAIVENHLTDISSATLSRVSRCVQRGSGGYSKFVFND